MFYNEKISIRETETRNRYASLNEANNELKSQWQHGSQEANDKYARLEEAYRKVQRTSGN